MSRLLDDMYKTKKDRAKQELSDAFSKVHLGFDLWTSPNRHAVVAVTAHFLDRQASISRAYWHSDANLGVIAGRTSR
jgi:hypothetical protein